MKNIAHRGFSSKYPENTILAFEKARQAGADGVELDVHLSKDGIPIIIHDEKLDRTCDKKGLVKDFTSQELKKVNAAFYWEKDLYEPIPMLEEYLKLIHKEDFLINIELKNNIIDYRGIEERVYALIKKYNLIDKVIISSFNHISIMKMKKIAPQIKCGILTESYLYKPWTYLEEMGIKYYHPSIYAINEDLLDRLHQEAIKVILWHGKEEFDLAKIIGMGADGLISNYPNQVKKMLEKKID